MTIATAWRTWTIILYVNTMNVISVYMYTLPNKYFSPSFLTSTCPTPPYKDTPIDRHQQTLLRNLCFSQPKQNKSSQDQPDEAIYLTSSLPIYHPSPHNATQMNAIATQYPDATITRCNIHSLITTTTPSKTRTQKGRGGEGRRGKRGGREGGREKLQHIS